MPNLLVIEDNPTMRSMLRHLLEKEGYTVLTAEDGPEGLALARTEPPDLILLDLMLPYMSGKQIARYIHDHQELRDIPVIVLTAIGEAAQVKELLDLGVRGYILKPPDAHELAQRISSVLAACSDDAGSAPSTDAPSLNPESGDDSTLPESAAQKDRE